MVNLDPGIVDQNKVRKTRRLQLIKTVIIPVIILAASGILFLRPGIYNIIMSMSYRGADYATAKSMSEAQDFINLFESYIAEYNAGVSNIRLKKYNEAEENFRNSLTENPPQNMLCNIYVNLSYSIEMQGDQRAENEDLETAIELYNRAESTLYNNGCASKNEDSTGKDIAAEDAKKRIADKRQSVAKEIAGANEVINQDNDKNDGELNEKTMSVIDELNLNDKESMRNFRQMYQDIINQNRLKRNDNKKMHW